MKKSKRVVAMVLITLAGVLSLAGCGKKNEPTADLTNWINAIYVADTYDAKMKTTFTEDEFKECKKTVKQEIEKSLKVDQMGDLKEQIGSIAKDGSEEKIDGLVNKLKDGLIDPMLKAYKNVKFSVEEVSKDGEKASIKVKSAPIDLNGTMEKVMKSVDEKTKGFDLTSVTPENAVDSFDKAFVTPMCEAYAGELANPVYLPEKEVVINMEYNKEAGIWKPVDADMSKLESIFIQ